MAYSFVLCLFEKDNKWNNWNNKLPLSICYLRISLFGAEEPTAILTSGNRFFSWSFKASIHSES